MLAGDDAISGGDAEDLIYGDDVQIATNLSSGFDLLDSMELETNAAMSSLSYEPMYHGSKAVSQEDAEAIALWSQAIEECTLSLLKGITPTEVFTHIASYIDYYNWPLDSPIIVDIFIQYLEQRLEDEYSLDNPLTVCKALMKMTVNSDDAKRVLNRVRQESIFEELREEVQKIIS